LKRLVSFILGSFRSNKDYLKKIYRITGFYPANIHCYQQALRHHSASKRISSDGSKDSNERLEYLGDAILNAIIANYLFGKFPYKDEGFLTQLRSKIVSRESLNDLAIKIGLSPLVEYDRKALHNITVRNSIFGNALEAFIGAVFLDSGYESARKFILDKIIKYHIDIDKLQATETNFKGRLIEYGQKLNKQIEFDVDEVINSNQKIFNVKILIDRVLMGQAESASKKKAEQLASEKAYIALGI